VIAIKKLVSNKSPGLPRQTEREEEERETPGARGIRNDW